MDNFIKNRANFVLFCCFIILLVWLSFLNRISGILAQESKIDIQSINKYFNRDLPEPIFNKLHKLGTKLIYQNQQRRDLLIGTSTFGRFVRMEKVNLSL